MPLSALTCPSCGAKEIVRRDGRFACSYCKATFVPRLSPGTLCGDATSGAHCGKPAETLCRGCALPLCDRHNDPKVVYWHASLHWRHQCPGWSPQDGAEWERLQRPRQRLPVPGFEPFAWAPHDRNAQYELGLLETEIFERVKPLARDAGGDLDDQAARFESVCCECEKEAEGAIDATVAGFAGRYRALAYRDRLGALRAEAEQGIRYVEAFLGRSISRRPPAGDGPVAGVDGDSPKQDWDRLGHELKQRLEAIARLEKALGTGS